MTIVVAKYNAFLISEPLTDSQVGEFQTRGNYAPTNVSGSPSAGASSVTLTFTSGPSPIKVYNQVNRVKNINFSVTQAERRVDGQKDTIQRYEKGKLDAMLSFTLQQADTQEAGGSGAMDLFQQANSLGGYRFVVAIDHDWNMLSFAGMVGTDNESSELEGNRDVEIELKNISKEPPFYSRTPGGLKTKLQTVYGVE